MAEATQTSRPRLVHHFAMGARQPLTVLVWRVSLSRALAVFPSAFTTFISASEHVAHVGNRVSDLGELQALLQEL